MTVPTQPTTNYMLPSLFGKMAVNDLGQDVDDVSNRKSDLTTFHWEVDISKMHSRMPNGILAKRLVFGRKENETICEKKTPATEWYTIWIRTATKKRKVLRRGNRDRRKRSFSLKNVCDHICRDHKCGLTLLVTTSRKETRCSLRSAKGAWVGLLSKSKRLDASLQPRERYTERVMIHGHKRVILVGKR